MRCLYQPINGTVIVIPEDTYLEVVSRLDYYHTENNITHCGCILDNSIPDSRVFTYSFSRGYIWRLWL